MGVWDHYFGKNRVNVRIRGDKVKDVIWHIRKLDVNKEVRYVALLCRTNSINKNIPADIVKGIKYMIQLGNVNFTTTKL